AAAADVLTGVEAGAALAHDDRPGGHLGAVVDLDAEALAVGVAAVPGGTAALGLGHVRSALRDAGDLDGGVALAVSPPAPLVRLVLVGEAGDLGALGVAHDLALHAGLGQGVRSGHDVAAVDQEDRGQLDLGVDRAQQLHLEPLALGDAVLLAAGLDHCVH